MKGGRRFFLFWAVLWGLGLSSCAFLPQREVGLKDFIQNISKDLECLTYCAQKKKTPHFALKDPITIHLSVSTLGKIKGEVTPNLFTITGLGLEGKKGRAGELTMKLNVVDHCKEVEVVKKPQDAAEAGPLEGGEKICFSNGDVFLDTIDGVEYLYVQGQVMDCARFGKDFSGAQGRKHQGQEGEGQKSPKRLVRFRLDGLQYVDCIEEPSNKKEPSKKEEPCNCEEVVASGHKPE